MQVFVSKVLLGLLDLSIIEPLGRPIFTVLALNGLVKLFPILPLPAFVNVDELLIHPLCAAVAEYCPLFFSEVAVFCVIGLYLGVMHGFITKIYDLWL
ncbi:hypothetical protein Ddc_16126 [Ditylenchus destructor]|nr:hypothetical protein Ddc_16126 [Ditylenchus destructor]